MSVGNVANSPPCEHDIDPCSKFCRKCGKAKWTIFVEKSVADYVAGRIKPEDEGSVLVIDDPVVTKVGLAELDDWPDDDVQPDHVVKKG